MGLSKHTQWDTQSDECPPLVAAPSYPLVQPSLGLYFSITAQIAEVAQSILNSFGKAIGQSGQQ